ncbi:hypothetical protein PSPO01_06837 [Paraphaeosphaeria sporulosa]
MSDLRGKGMPTAVKPLVPFLSLEPRMRHFYSAEPNEPMVCDIASWQERHCDIFIVESLSTGPLPQSINLEMMALRHEASSLIPTAISGKKRPWGDVKRVVMGINECDEIPMGTNYDSRLPVNTFVVLIYWTCPEAMLRFKDVHRESIRKYGWKVANDWWKTEVMERFARVEEKAARVKHGTFRLWDFEAEGPLIWPVAEAFANMERTDSVSRSPIAKSCKGCLIM